MCIYIYVYIYREREREVCPQGPSERVPGGPEVHRGVGDTGDLRATLTLLGLERPTYS